MNKTSPVSRQCKPESGLGPTLRSLAVAAALSMLGGCQSTLQHADSAACAPAVAASAWQPPSVYKGKERIDFDTAMSTLQHARVVLIGEYHTRLDHHLSQLEIICRLHESDSKMAIGVEFVQKPFQAALDAYIGGESSTEKLLIYTEYFQRWGYDYRLYEPLFVFAREHAIPIIALNAAAELSAKVGRDGMDSLSAEERAQVALDVKPADDEYRQRMKDVFDAHPPSHGRDFESFLAVQLLWDETMAETSASYLLANPNHRLVIIAGNGHVGYRNAMFNRLVRRVDATAASIAQVIADERFDTDYRLNSPEVMLPASGFLGVMLDVGENVIEISGFSQDSAAKAAGIETGDKLRSMDGRTISSYPDVKLALWSKAPGAVVIVEVERAGAPRTFELTLR